MSPEAQARMQIDAMLLASGWVIQDDKALNLSAAQGIALREVPLKSEVALEQFTTIAEDLKR
jgi:type I restriction enzyme R subunit